MQPQEKETLYFHDFPPFFKPLFFGREGELRKLLFLSPLGPHPLHKPLFPVHLTPKENRNRWFVAFPQIHEMEHESRRVTQDPAGPGDPLRIPPRVMGR